MKKDMIIKGVIGLVISIIVFSLYLIERNISQSIIALDIHIQENERYIRNVEDALATISEMQEELVFAVNELQEESGVTEETIVAIRTGIEEKREAEQAQEITTLVNAWENRIARVECIHHKENGDSVEAKSSGVLITIGSTLHVMTNKHVLEKKKRTLQECSVSFPQRDIDDIDIPLYAITKSEDRDLAYLRIDDPQIEIAFDITQKACSEAPHVGDRVITLGFPKVGAEQSVTVTEGIISGLEDDYYVTSAKIEEGNSGGATIITKDNCFAGIPTLAVVGSIESLARILPISSLSHMNLQ